jgi:hypothetical protein
MSGFRLLDIKTQKYLNEYFKLNLDLSKKIHNDNNPDSIILQIVNIIDSICPTQHNEPKTSRTNKNYEITLVDVIHNVKESQMILCHKDKHLLRFKILCVPILTVVIEEIDVVGTIIVGDIVVETGDVIVNTFTNVDTEDKIKLYLTKFLQFANQ